jgi:hypothetical protein
MDIVHLRKIKHWFQNYVDTFNDHNGQWHRFCEVKVDHCRRVAHEMRTLSKSLNWLPTGVLVAEAIGWLHDIGRFSQFRDFGTFSDAQSVNHGVRGWQVILQSNIVSDLPDNEQQSILDAVYFHNGKALPGDLGKESLAMLKLIRDADKLNIFYVVYDALVQDGFQDLQHMLPHIKMDGPINPIILNELRWKRACSLTEVRSLTDFMLLQLSWIYDINYLPTFQQIAQRDIIANLLSYLPTDNHAINNVVGAIKRHADTSASAGTFE